MDYIVVHFLILAPGNARPAKATAQTTGSSNNLCDLGMVCQEQAEHEPGRGGRGEQRQLQTAGGHEGRRLWRVESPEQSGTLDPTRWNQKQPGRPLEGQTRE